MQQAKPYREAGKEIGLLIALGAALLVLSYIRILGDTGSAAFRTKIIDAALSGPIWGTALGDNLMIFGVTQFLVHVGFAFLCLALAKLSRMAWPNSNNSTCTWTVLWFVLGTVWLLIANAAMYPWSSLGQPYAEWATTAWRELHAFSVYTSLMVALLIWTLVSALRRMTQTSLRTPARLLVLTGIVAVAVLLFDSRNAFVAQAAQDKPNVIVIGMDSLRFDAVRQSPASITPAIDGFLGTAIDFTDATTPLARTFPAWTSIITGRHPHTTGAVINLLPRKMIHTGETLPEILKGEGYRTVYAIDEVRFSNLDRTYGFDEMIAPPIGSTDFLLGFLGDAPLSNLLTNSPLGEWLFPYLYANRAAAHVYDPDSFVNRLDRRLRFDKPTFLAVHFTLAHWPFTWADAPEEINDTAESSSRHFYEPAVARLDQQFADVMRVLEKRGALRNAIVIILSDHGESLGRLSPEPRPQGQHVEIEFEDDRLLGHGTSVFSEHQYHVVFAVKSFGTMKRAASEHRSVDAPISLEDLTPTLLELLQVKTNSTFDGVSLAHILAGDSDLPQLRDRIRFTETEFNPQGVLPGQIISGSSLLHAATYYRVDPETDRVLIRSERLGELLDSRQYAAFRNGKLIAAVPTVTPSGTFHRPLLMVQEEPPVSVPDPMSHSDPEVVALWSALLERFPELIDRIHPESMHTGGAALH